jgi:dTDP-4-amino-4,6-dideoxygalactose transaminase
MPNPTSVPVPLFDAKIQYKALYLNLEEAFKRVLASGQAIGGPEVEAFEKEIADYCGASQAVACASGTDAISLALAALGIGPGDEVIVPPFSFFATASCVSRLGARPVFVDIDPDTYNMDVLQVENKITPRTKAIMPVHLFGQSVDMEPLWHIAERHNLPLVEDAAQAIGTEYQGKRTGTLGAIAAFSFYPTKNLGAYGDGGMVVTPDFEWAEKIRWLRNHGMKKRYYHDHMGWNSRLDAVQAAMLRVKLQYLNLWTEGRRAIAQRYNSMIDEHQLGHFLTKPTVKNYGKHVFNQYVVRVKNGQRDALRDWLKADQIGTEIYYPVPLHLQKVYASLGYEKGDFPATEQACREVMALPIFPELSIEQQRRVMGSCASFLRQQVRLAA